MGTRALFRPALLLLALSPGLLSCSTDCPNCPGAAATVKVSPATSSVLPGGQIHLVAEVFDAEGRLLTVGNARWSSNAKGTATVTDSGQVQGVAAGQAMITVKVGGISGTGTVNVVTTSTFSGQVYPILATNCATAFCHVSPGPPPNLSSAAAAYTALTTGVPSTGGNYVVAGDSTTGVLLDRLTDATRPMPPGGAFATGQQGLYDLITAWIAAGAQNN